MVSFVLAVLVGAGILCNGAQGQTGLSASDKDELLIAQNYFRGIVDPIATNMERMIWNDELSVLAQNYADMCIWGHNADRHTQSTTFTFVGENLAITTADPGNYTGLVNAWFNEIQDFDYAANTCRAGAACGHYTQLAWATSNEVGCGAVRCDTVQNFGSPNALYLVCNYGPSGNINTATMRPYETGTESCSACPEGKPECVENLCSPAGSISPTTTSTTESPPSTSDPPAVQPSTSSDASPAASTSDASPAASTAEPSPTPEVCGPSEFRCPGLGNQTCIPESYVCNGVDDCPNGADEDDFTCPIPTATVTPEPSIFIGLFPAEIVVSEARPRAQLRYCVEVLTGDLDDSVEVVVESVDGTFATSRDFTNFTDHFLIKPGEQDRYSPRGYPLYCRSTRINITNDRRAEKTYNEYFYLFVYGYDYRVTSTDGQGDTTIVFIADNDIAQIGFDKPSYVVNEGNGSVEVCVRVRSGELGYPINFRVSIGDGTAEDGIDYNATDVLPALGYLSHVAQPMMPRPDDREQDPSPPPDDQGQPSRPPPDDQEQPPRPPRDATWCVDLPILEDLEEEGEERMTLELFTGDLQIIARPRTAEVIITDNDVQQALKAYITGDSPRVTVGGIEVDVATNKPATVECRLSRKGFRSTTDCSPGTTARFTNLLFGTYTLRVTATADDEEDEFTSWLKVPAYSQECTVNLINNGVEPSGSDAMVEFAGVGPYTGFTCRLDGEAIPCTTVPLQLTGLSPGRHRLRVVPDGCSETTARTFNVDI